MTEGTRAPYDSDDFYGISNFGFGAMGRRSRRKSRKKAKKSRSSSKRARRKRKRTVRMGHRKRRASGRGKVRTAKNGAKYIILANGKCRFVKKNR